MGPSDGYVAVTYHPGPRRLGELQTLLGHAKQLLARHGWHKVLGDQRLLSPFTPEERTWLADYWLQISRQRTRVFYGAVLLSQGEYEALTPEQATLEAQESDMTYRLFAEVAMAEAWLALLP
jgi:hypothetical protein